LIGSDGIAHNHIWLGDYGERVAAAWLRTQQIKVLAKNYRGQRRGEVDIVARDGKLLLFIEVKTRREGSKIRPLDAVTRDKQALIERGANSWLKELGHRDLLWRFDVIEVYVQEGQRPRINRIRDAF
jgi:putative endonuclease